MPLTSNILAGIQITDILTLAAFILLLFIALLLIVLIVPLRFCLFLYKNGRLVEGKLRGSWLGISAGGELISKESATIGRLWISFLSIRIINREISAPSALDFIGLVTKRERGKEKKGYAERKEGAERKEEKAEDSWRDLSRHDKSRQDESRHEQNSISRESTSGESEAIDDEDGIRTPRLRSILAAMPAFMNFLRDLTGSINFKTIRCRLELGLDDPSETAILAGRLWAIAAFLRYLGADILIKPYFEDERLEGEFLAEAGMRPIHVPVAFISALSEKGDEIADKRNKFSKEHHLLLDGPLCALCSLW